MSTTDEFANAYKQHLDLKEQTKDNIKVLREMLKDSEKRLEKLARELGQPSLFEPQTFDPTGDR